MIKPLGDRVVIEPSTQQEKTESGIILPDTAQEKPQEGRVLAVGDCETIKKDDLVLYPKYSGTEITHNGQDVLIVSEKEVLAVVG
jgi:chaperonin GroES|tara:strand:+ start:204 stop:458 length:255 start_codon:yes stop_codon:yes gene_type:complete